MNGKRAKSIRRYVAETFPYLSDTSMYSAGPRGEVVLNNLCKRSTYQSIKRAWKKAKAYKITFRRTK